MIAVRADQSDIGGALASLSPRLGQLWRQRVTIEQDALVVTALFGYKIRMLLVASPAGVEINIRPVGDMFGMVRAAAELAILHESRPLARFVTISRAPDGNLLARLAAHIHVDVIGWAGGSLFAQLSIEKDNQS